MCRGGPGPAVVLITGVMASGKSTVAQALAERLPRAAHVRGDVFRRMVVSGWGKSGYGAGWTVESLDRVLREETPRIGLWLDTSGQTVEESVDAVLAGLDRARVDPGAAPGPGIG
ncbi:AAA family ATPase [Streptomyces sp. NBC_01435]|uniref:AAA family ATPase n=1 Tax=Streptomyces sp. NBC_01435 TaxID=2903865 RepID=UPI002E352427|nr:AAA family ATPase [Streptomyces sp. NBC_01435]